MPVTKEIGNDYSLTINHITSSLKECSAAMSKLSNDASFVKYWSNAAKTGEQAAQMTDRLKESLSAYSKEANTANANEVVKSFNALKAVTDKDYMSGLTSQIENFDRVVNAAFSKASAVIKADFDTSRFQMIFTLLETMKAELGPGFANAFQQIGTSAAGFESATQRIQELEAEVKNYKGQIAEIGSGGDASDLLAKLEAAEATIGNLQNEITSLNIKSSQMFEGFIKSGTGMSIDDILKNGLGDYSALNEYRNQIAEGAMSLSDAMAKARLNYSDLFTSGSGGSVDSSVLQSIQTQLETILTKANEVSAAIANLPQNLQSVKAAPDVKDQVGNLQQVISLLGDLTNNKGGEQAAASLQSLIDVMKQLSAIGGIDSKNLASMRVIFTQLNELTNLNIDISQFATLRNGLEKLSGLSKLEKLRALSDINLSGLNNIKVSSTINSQLAPFLQSAATFDVDQINKLASINFSGLQALSSDNFKVSKASMENLKNLVTYNSQLDEKNAGLTGLSEQVQSLVTTLQANPMFRVDTSEAEAEMSELENQIVETEAEAAQGSTTMDVNTAPAEEHVEELGSEIKEVQGEAASGTPTMNIDTSGAESSLEELESKTDEVQSKTNQEFKVSVNANTATKTFKGLDNAILAYREQLNELDSKSKLSTTKFGTASLDTSKLKSAIDDLQTFKSQTQSAQELQENWSTYLEKLTAVSSAYDLLKNRLDAYEASAKAANAADKASAPAEITADQSKAWDQLTTKIEEYKSKLKTITTTSQNAGVADAIDTTTLSNLIAKLEGFSKGSKQGLISGFESYSETINKIAAEVSLLSTKIAEAKAQLQADNIAAQPLNDFSTAIEKDKASIDSLIAKINAMGTGTGFSQLISQLETTKRQLDLIKDAASNGSTTLENAQATASKKMESANQIFTNAQNLKSAIAEANKELNQYQTMLNNGTKSLTSKNVLGNPEVFSEWTRQLESFRSQFESVKQSIANDGSYVNTDAGQAALKNLGNAATDLKAKWDEAVASMNQNSIDASMANLSKNISAYISKYGDQLQSKIPEVYQSLQDLQAKVASGTVTKTEGTEMFAGIQQSAIEAGVGVETLGQKIQAVFSNRFSYMITGMAFMKVRQLCRELVTNVKEIDEEMAQLSIVTGTSGDRMTEYFEQASEAAQEYGASVTDVMSSMETFSRLGYDLQEALDLTNAATMLSNVADTTVDESTTGLTSIIKGFNLESTSAELVADELTAVGQDYAVSASELMEALERGGSSLYAANNTLEQSIALIAAGNASVQDASTVGTAMKTLSARIRSSTAELDDMGKIICSAA